MLQLVSQETFSQWLLEEQLAYLDERLTSETGSELWRLCARSPDSGPLLHLSRRMAESGFPLSGSELLLLPPVVLGSLLEQPFWLEAAESAWQQATLDQLISFCLLDRYLRRRDLKRWEALGAKVEAQAEELLRTGSPPSPSLLMRVSGSAQRRLERAHPEAWVAWTPIHQQAAHEALRLLAARPRDVSQANAERLLAQQVYTDPGHFLLELLQNADDAEATLLEARFEPHQITVINDGVPFDFRDLVGLLSIGQTTKKSSQIGYFGVGFKSVYQVTDRPRLASGPFHFEIADISISRPLAGSEEAGQTVLELPLKKGVEVEELWGRALELDPALLLNLPSLQEIVFVRGAQQHRLSLDHLGGSRHRLSWGPEQRTYQLLVGSYRHPWARPVGKAQVAEVRVAFPEDEQPLGTSLYSFLPVLEESGLRFVVSSHFDVPVDRERLDPDSDWNRGLIATLAPLLAGAFAQDPELGYRSLSRLPLPEDPLSESFVHLPTTLVDLVAPLALFPSPDGSRRPARDVRLVHPDLAQFYQLDQLPDGVVYLEDPRLRRWIQELGGQEFDLEALLLELTEGRLPFALALQDRDGDGDGAGRRAWNELHRLLNRDCEPSVLREVPVLLDHLGCPAAPKELVVLDPGWGELFTDPPRHVDLELAELSHCSTLLNRLGMSRLDWEQLLALLDSRGAEVVHLKELYCLLKGAPPGTIREFFQRPLFPDCQGKLGPLAAPLFDSEQTTITVLDPEVPAELFPNGRFLAEDEGIEELLEQLGWPRMDLSQALEALAWEELSAESAELLLEAVARSCWQPTATAIQILVSLPIFQSTQGDRRTLNSLWRFSVEGLEELLTYLPALAPESLSAGVVEKFELQRYQPEANLDVLLGQLETQPQKLDIPATLDWLAGKAWRLSRDQLERLFECPIFGPGAALPLVRDQRQHRFRDGLLVADPEFVEIFQSLGLPVLTTGETERIWPLLEVAQFAPLGLPELVESLLQKPPRVEVLPKVQALFLSCEEELLSTVSTERRKKLPVWLTVEGQVTSGQELPPSDQLGQLTGRGGRRPVPGQEGLMELFPPNTSEQFLLRCIELEVRVGAPLSEQPDWCDSVAKVDAVASHLRYGDLAVDAAGLLRDVPLFRAPKPAYLWLSRSSLVSALIHPDSSAEQLQNCEVLDGTQLLECYLPWSREAEVRKAFYEALDSLLHSVTFHPESRETLLNSPLWLNSQGEFKRLTELVWDLQVPDLAGDWTPHAEIPRELLERLASLLRLQRSSPELLLGERLWPSYLARPSWEVLEALATIGAHLDGEKIRQILPSAALSGRIPLPAGSDLHQVYLPPTGYQGMPSLRPLRLESPSEETLIDFFRKLGLSYLPPAQQLLNLSAGFAPEDSEALLALVEWAWKNRPEELETLWEVLTRIPWLMGGDGTLRLPAQMFVQSGEMEDLVGQTPELFPRRRLSVALARRLGLKEEADLDPMLVGRHLLRQAALGIRVSQRVYTFLEGALASGKVEPGYLRNAFSGSPWIWTDEGEYRSAGEVLGQPSFRTFGPYRGTWEGVHQRYPKLASLFAIPAEVTPRVVLDFLKEMDSEPFCDSLTRLLRASLAVLGGDEQAAPAKNWRVIPARSAQTGDATAVSAQEPGLVRSNSPTLVALFASSGRLYLADEGVEQDLSSALNRVYDRLGIPLLREAYTVHPDLSGRDLTQEMGAEVVAFRRLLRGLEGVLPRLRAARPEWEAGEWLADSRLRVLADQGRLRVLKQLRVTYRLPGVGEVAVEAAAVFDPEKRELLLSAAAVQRPREHAVSLSEGLLELIYQGPSSEGMVDLLNLLIPWADREGMDAYLDQRHFPNPSSPESRPGARLQERLGEILDYGLTRELERRFPELSGLDWSPWRTHRVRGPEGAKELMELLGVVAPAEALLTTLDEMLKAQSLEHWLRENRQAAGGTQAEPNFSSFSVQPRALTSPGSFSPSERGFQPAVMREPKVTLSAKIREKVGRMLSTPVLGLNSSRLNPGETVDESYRNPPECHLVVSNKNLEGQDLYCLNQIFTSFHSRSQCYYPTDFPEPGPSLPSGRTLEFSGRLFHPEDPLPMPLGSRLTGAPMVAGGGTLIGPGKYGQFHLKAEDPQAQIVYQVELGAPPDYSSCRSYPNPGVELLRSSVKLETLPPPVQDWVSFHRATRESDLRTAQDALAFVVGHYRYDLSFREHPNFQRDELLTRGLGSENLFLRGLHAAADGQFLGGGSCIELSILLLEILRLVGIPCAMADVWALERGLIHRCDHNIVLVLLEDQLGSVWLPLDPSFSRIKRTEVGQTEPTRAELLRAAVELVLGQEAAASFQGSSSEGEIEEALLGRLGTSGRLEALLECLAQGERNLWKLEGDLLWLAQNGYLKVEQQRVYRVLPRWPKSEN